MLTDEAIEIENLPHLDDISVMINLKGLKVELKNVNGLKNMESLGMALVIEIYAKNIIN